MQQIIDRTRAWVEKVVVGFNFCPFAYREVQRNSIRYVVSEGLDKESILTDLLLEMENLNLNEETETTLLILPLAFADFEEYLDLVDLAEALVYDRGYEGIYQVASFHPDYLFADSDEDDAANYTNRSPYPMLHLLREASLERALEHHPNPEGIPERNVGFAREKGLAYMQLILEEIMKTGG